MNKELLRTRTRPLHALVAVAFLVFPKFPLLNERQRNELPNEHRANDSPAKQKKTLRVQKKTLCAMKRF